ncbi:MAG: hypothetical protein JWO09_2246 [Bacteroidetes bacterium]|nr:hypothetical protein [Bacteroidota bacterium]
MATTHLAPLLKYATLVAYFFALPGRNYPIKK